MKKIINPCTCMVGTRKVDAFCKIEYVNGELTIAGVVGPKCNGDCFGAAGQCVNYIRNGTPTDEWSSETLNKFCDIWDEWHLNYTRAYCSHMKELGWTKLLREEVEVKKWNAKHIVYAKHNEAVKRAKECLKKGIAFIPTEEETMYYNLELSVTTYNGEKIPNPEFYEFREKDCIGNSNVEYKKRGWLSIDETEFGFIGKQCPVCGYKYGTKWLKENVPDEIVRFLEQLPDSKKKPAWV